MVLSFAHLAGEALREAARRIEGANLAHPETKSGLQIVSVRVPTVAKCLINAGLPENVTSFDLSLG